MTALNLYPVKSCRGIPLEAARLSGTGLADDRHWMMVRPNGRFVTQRELPRLALIRTAVDAAGLRLEAPGMPPLSVPRDLSVTARDITVWRFKGRGLDCGDAAAGWCTTFLDTPLRLVSFDPSQTRECSPEWTQGLRAITEFADGYPVLIISRASLAELNSRLPKPLPMTRFRPNIVVDGIDAYGEDRIHELRTESVTLRIVKPCVRCAITTTDQDTGTRDGAEPLATLKTYRFDRELGGVCFGQNAIVTRGVGASLHVGEKFEVSWRS
ncbi:MAG TPA: MOSC N-terminal beta barrel domain-containing protein [Steroidobacteraceae bacterium]|nr:MOSC N-terminal beta barrel domain-containing protein [Steroidobacteraceae bacterium]